MGKCSGQNLAHRVSVRFTVGIFYSYSHIGTDFTDEGLGVQHTLASCTVWNLPEQRAGPGCGTPGQWKRQALAWTKSGRYLWAQTVRKELSEPLGFSSQPGLLGPVGAGWEQGRGMD